MAVCVLSKAFRRLNVFKKEIVSVHYTTQQTELPIKTIPILWQEDKSSSKLSERYVTYTPRFINLKFDIPKTELPLSKIIECPVLPNFQIDDPIKNNIEKSDIMPDKVIEVPSISNIVEKQAARLITIRRKKMKKHKRRKFLKKMKFVIRRKKERKANLKEKMFQAELQAIYAKAKKFDPKEYVAERLHLLTRERLPNKWRGVLLPEEQIKQFMKEKEEKEAHKRRLNTYKLKLD